MKKKVIWSIVGVILVGIIIAVISTFNVIWTFVSKGLNTGFTH